MELITTIIFLVAVLVGYFILVQFIINAIVAIIDEIYSGFPVVRMWGRWINIKYHNTVKCIKRRISGVGSWTRSDNVITVKFA